MPSSVRIPGRREQGDRCPNCDWPIPDPKAKVIEAIPGQGTFTCEHCGWTLTAPQFGQDNLTPRPGRS